jgi:hypothetical protein
MESTEKKILYTFYCSSTNEERRQDVARTIFHLCRMFVAATELGQILIEANVVVI